MPRMHTPRHTHAPAPQHTHTRLQTQLHEVGGALEGPLVVERELAQLAQVGP